MRVLITGHLGYIGPVMIRVFKEAGHQVTGLDVGYFRDCQAEGLDLVPPDREIVRDVRDVQRRDLDGLDAVVHLAALSNDPLGKLNPQLTLDINYRSSVALARLAKEAGVERFVFASSCSIYGASGDSSRPLDETAPVAPVSAYAESKVKTEESLWSLAGKSFSPVSLRNATAYGVSPRIRFDLVLNNLMACAWVTGKIRVLSDGTPWRPLVHIEDISRGAVAAVEAPRDAVHAQAFNIGRDDGNYQVRDIAEAVHRVMPDCAVEITGESGGDPRSYRVDFSKAKYKLPGFQAQWTLEKGCRELKDWFEAGNLGSREYESRMFVRLKQLRYLMDERLIDGNLRFAPAQRVPTTV